MAIECPHCHAIHAGPLPTFGLPVHRCPACRQIFPAARPAATAVAVADQTDFPTRPAADPPPTEQSPGSRPLTLTPPPGLMLPSVPGYRVERVIGRGGMGTVYLARQMSLDRPVALKVMSRRWAGDPVFVARFTREAFAAARLAHPNLVQVFDIGEANGVRYFSMEYVPGNTLADVLKDDGKLDADTAVGYVLQAARGLAHAHDRGLIHRDIKPDNLLLSPDGLVKVADLGLVKVPADPSCQDTLTETWSRVEMETALRGQPADVTGARMALGTPAYMSPEQCRDAAAVDHRADVYSLGCTLYALLTGKQPFDGDTAVELMTKHAYQPLVPPEEVAARVPRELSAVIQKMMAKHPGERFQTMHEVVRVLENWLGVTQTARVSAKEEQIAALEGWVERFTLAPTAVLRQRVLTGFLSACLLAAVVLTCVGRLGWAFGVAAMVIQAAGIYFVLSGFARKSHLFTRVRQLAAGMSVGDAVVGLAVVGMGGVLLWMLKLFWLWVGFGLIGVGLAVALRLAFDRAADAERDAAVRGCGRLLRKLRKAGADEDQVRLFVARYAGRYWEEFFEAVFGYEAKLATRSALARGGAGGPREIHAGWREPVLAVIDRIERSRTQARERELLVETETAKLVAAGATPRQAARQARATADAAVAQADALHAAESRRRMLGLSTTAATAPAPALRTPGWPAWLLAGPPARGLLGGLLVAMCLAWAWQNAIWEMNGELGSPLAVPGLSADWTAWCDTANVGWAGVLLLTSLFYRGQRTAMLSFVAAGVTLFAHKFHGMPSAEPLQGYHAAATAGTVIALVGYRFGRR